MTKVQRAQTLHYFRPDPVPHESFADCLQAGVRDVITLFHAPKNPASIRVYTFLKQTAANAQTTATEDQAGSHDKQSKAERTEYDLRMSVQELGV